MCEDEDTHKHETEEDNMQNSDCGRWSVNEQGRDGGSEREKESDDSFHQLESC